MAIRKEVVNLAEHADTYVTVAQLSDYWKISRKQIYKHIDQGRLQAVRLGPRLFRIRTEVARQFEQAQRVGRERPAE